MADILSTLSIVAFVIAIIFLAVTIFFWFFFKIPTVIGDLSGRTARKSIAKMRTANQKSRVKVYRESKVNAERGKITSVMPDTESTIQNNATRSEKSLETGYLPTEENATELLKVDVNETTMLTPDVEETSMLTPDINETTMLMEDDNETTMLNEETPQFVQQPNAKKLTMLDEVILIHTDEVIL